MSSSLADFKVEKFLGQGSYGSVYKVLRKSDGKNYALKQVKIRYMTQAERYKDNEIPNGREEALNEVRILASVKHPAVIRYCDSFYEKDKLYIITDFAEKGDLNNELKKRKLVSPVHKFEENTIWSYFIQLVIGMCDLHKRNILHRNIFLTGEQTIKIGDLGVAKLLKAGLTKTQVGTPYYISPEIWRKMPYDHKSDVWSLGCVLYELATFRHPFLADSPKGLAVKIMAGKYPKVTGYSADLVDVIKRLLVVDASRRPSMEEILQLPSVKSRMYLVPSELRDYTERSSDLPKVQMVKTIKVPRNLGLLKQNLPDPSYPTPQPRAVKKVFASPPRQPSLLLQEPRRSSVDLSDRRPSAAPVSKVKVPSREGGVRVSRVVRPRPVSSPVRVPSRVSRPVLRPKNLQQEKASRPQPLRVVAKPVRAPSQGKENAYKVEAKGNYMNIPKPAVDPLQRLHQVAAEIERIRKRRKALQEMVLRKFFSQQNRRMQEQMPIPQFNYRNVRC